MTGFVEADRFHDALEATWPAARLWQQDGWILRDGASGGKRVSAATALSASDPADPAIAAKAMRDIGQVPLFMIRKDDTELDHRLDALGYDVIDPVNVYAAPLQSIAAEPPPRLSSFDLWGPLAIQCAIWAAGGIGPARIEVMRRVTNAKTALLGREAGRAAGAGFVALYENVAMVHALEVLPAHRRKGVGRNLTRHAAHWAVGQGADTLAVLCTKANQSANALYASMGFLLVGEYHYRIARGEEP